MTVEANARRFLEAAAPQLAFLPVNGGDFYAPMKRCRLGHWWFVEFAHCEACADLRRDAES